MHIESVLETLHALRADGKFEEAFEFSKEHLAGQAQYQSIIFQQQPPRLPPSPRYPPAISPPALPRLQERC